MPPVPDCIMNSRQHPHTVLWNHPAIPTEEKPVNRRTRTWALSLLAACLALPVLAQSGADTFNSKCAMCHGANGLGATPMAKTLPIPSFRSPALMKASNATLMESITKGRGKMPAYGGFLNDAQIRAVVAHIRTLQKK
jgi:mono/diheme cytochrome c family protein